MLSYRNYMLGLLMVILAFNYVDRQVMAIVLQDIKYDLDLSDTQLGLLSGMAFAFFYAVMGIPIARWADRGNRVTIISATAVLWSVMVMFCGMATNFIQLLLARVGVAVGEAGCLPPANSLIPEYFSKAERPRAVAIYMLGSSLSVVIGYWGGSLLNDWVGWRMTFILLGLPGVILGLLAWFTLREPRLKKNALDVPAESHDKDESPSLLEVIKALSGNAPFVHLLLVFTFMTFFGSGIGMWVPSFFIRVHSMAATEIGFWMAIIYGLVSAVGVYGGGVLASRYAANNERLQFQVMTVVFVLFSIIMAMTFLTPNKNTALLFLGLGVLPIASIAGPLFASIQGLVDARMRAMAIAVIYLMANLIGLGLGPLAIGAVSDAFLLRFGNESLRYALALFCPGYLIGALHLWLASRHMDARPSA